MPVLWAFLLGSPQHDGCQEKALSGLSCLRGDSFSDPKTIGKVETIRVTGTPEPLGKCRTQSIGLKLEFVSSIARSVARGFGICRSTSALDQYRLAMTGVD